MSTINQQQNRNQRGSAFLLTLFFSSIFLMMFGAVLSFIVVQHRAVQYEVWEAQGLHSAEAGIQYYRWHLAHDPTDYVTDTGVHTYNDPEGGGFSSYDISVTPPDTGSTVAVITAEGVPDGNPNVSARVQVRYGQPSLARYAFLTNSNVWFGDTEEISGQLHSNGGVRMDGVGDSILSSAQETYICGSEHGCSNETKDGVWGTGVDAALWEYPIEPVDFNALLVDLNTMQTDAVADGIYLGDSGAQGYFIEFASDGTLTVNTVTSVHGPVYGYDGSAWTYESNSKNTWTPLAGHQNISLPTNGIIFAEDDVWVSGQVRGRATVAAARLTDVGAPPADIYIQDDITYTATDGTDVLALIGQEDVIVPLRAEDDLEIHAALMAVSGHAYRYYYPAWSSEPYATYNLRDTIETYGSVITNTTWTWSWVSGGGSTVSGFENTSTNYDSNLTYSPPPSFPTENEYAFISWEELELNE